MSNSLASVHPELISEWSKKNLPLTPDKITFGSNKRVWWKGACGHEWETSVKARSKGEKCPICSGARVIEGINDLATLKPLLAQEWSEKNELKPTEVSVASHKKIIWKCKHGHEWEASVKSRTINGTGCPYCSHNKVLAGFNDLASQYPDIAAEWSDRNLPLLPTMVTAFANSKAWWKCRDCGNEWYTLISTRSGGSRCPYCSGYTLIWTKELSMLITRWYIMTIEPTVVSVAVILISIPRKLRLENAKFRCWISSKKHSLWKKKDRSCLIFIVKLLWTDILILSFLTVLDSRNIRQPLTKQSVVSSVTAMMNSF